MREIKVRFWYGIEHSKGNKEFFSKTFTLEEIMNGKPFEVLSDNPFYKNWRMWDVKEQFTGLQDKNGVDIYKGDLLNIYYEMGGYIFDGIYEVSINFKGVVFRFKKLPWESYGHNQLPIYDTLDSRYICDRWSEYKHCILNINHNKEWILTKHIEVIGNIHEGTNNER